MHIQELISWYQTKTDEELVRLATDLAQLTPEAQSALSSELARRRLDVHEQTDEQSNVAEATPEEAMLPKRQSSRSYQTHEFIAEVLRVYHSQLWFFLKLIAPAVVGSYLTIWYSRQIIRETTERFFQTHEGSFSTIYPELLLLSFTRYLISWSLFFFAFGVICIAVSQMETKIVPSFQSALTELWKSKKPCLQLCILLFVFALIAYGISGAFFAVLVWASGEMHIHLSHWMLFFASFILGGFLYLVLSRFALAVPAVVLDGYSVWRAIFLSDELTEGKWSILATLMMKSLMGGYIAGMLPYWLGPWVASHIPTFAWFPWIQAGLSLIAVMLVEPPMFVGFALLYVRMSEESSDATAVRLTNTVATSA